MKTSAMHAFSRVSFRTPLVVAGSLALALSVAACGDDDSGSEISAASSRACDQIVECVQPETPIELDRDQICQGFDAAISAINVVGGSCRSAVLNYYDCIENTPCATIVGDDNFCESQAAAAEEVCDVPDDENTNPVPGDTQLSDAAQNACENAAACNDSTPDDGACQVFEGYLEFASFFGPSCTNAVEDYLVCVADASCSELDGDSCDAQEAAADSACTFSTD